MSASFEEKSVWIQLVAMLVGLGAYAAVAGVMLSRGVDSLIAYIPLFALAVVMMVAVLVAGHIVIAIARRPEAPDERDRLIGWRSESNASWVLGFGVFTALVALVVSADNVWVAHILLASMFLSELVKYGYQLVYYRRGI